MTCERPEDMRARIERKGYRTGTQFGSLMSQIVYGDIPELKDAMMLPTPVVCLDGVYADKNPNSKRHSKSLATLAYHKMLPTPRANIVNGLDLYNPNVAKRNNGNLEEAISALLLKGLMPTPTTSSRNGGTAKEREDGVSRRSELNHLVAQECGTTSQLSPLFVEEMMGFPTGWILLPFLKESPVPQEPSPSTDGAPNP